MKLLEETQDRLIKAEMQLQIETNAKTDAQTENKKLSL